SNVTASGFASYDPGRLQCTAGKTATCLTADQVGALRKLHSGAKNSAGQSLYSSWPWDPGIAGAQWISWKLGSSQTATPNSIKAATAGQGDAAGFARVFAAPGVGHCGGGPGLDNFPALSALMDWVEQGKAPDSMTATGTAVPGRSRPICAWPSWAKYKGTGDI